MQPRYTRGKPVDKERLAQYLEAAKGPGRTMKQFAEECKVNPSTLSRIANKKLVGASSETLMMAIFEHADPTSGITLETLMDANGMVPVGSVRIPDYRLQEMKSIELITSEMMRRVSALVYPQRQLRLSRTMGYTPDIIFESESFGGNGMWAFDIIPLSYASYRRDDMNERQVKLRIIMMNRRRFFDRLSRYANIGYFHPEEVPQRFSYVVLDKEYFDDIVNEYGEQNFRGNVSVVLIDFNNLKIVDEFIFHRQEGNMMDKFFTVPLKEGETNDVEGLIDIDDIQLGGDI